jgi:hypothetical protein
MREAAAALNRAIRLGVCPDLGGGDLIPTHYG